MDGEEIILFGGLAALVLLIMSEQKKNAEFADFMTSSGGSEADILSSIVPVDDQSTFNATQQQPTGGGAVASISDFVNAIFNHEGGKPGDLNVRNNNPGNLKHAPDEFTGVPTNFDSRGFVVFPNADSGFAALQHQLAKSVNEYPNLTLQQFFAKYLGQSDYLNPKVTGEGDPFAYAADVAKQIGVSAEQTLGQIFTGA